MAVSVKAPLLGEGVEELTIGRILVEEGSALSENAPIMEIESDKVVTELASPVAGVLAKIYVREGDVVKVGQTLALIENGEAEIRRPAPPSIPGSPSTPVPSTPASSSSTPSSPPLVSAATGGQPFLSPLARRLTAIHGIDPSELTGTGLGGRITKQDILDHLAARSAPPRASTGVPAGEDLKVPHSNARRRIAANLMETLRNAAPALTVMEADLGRIVAHRSRHKDNLAARGVRLTYTAYFVEAVARALRDHPEVNATWTDEALVVHANIDVGLAVSLGPDGLLVPVIRNVRDASLERIAAAVQDLAERARNRTLRPDETKGGTFSLTNHGTNGSLFAAPILVPGQIGILGVGAVRKRVVVVTDAEGNDAVAIRPMAYLSFVFDHRALDGEAADRFLASVKENLEGYGEA